MRSLCYYVVIVELFDNQYMIIMELVYDDRMIIVLLVCDMSLLCYYYGISMLL